MRISNASNNFSGQSCIFGKGFCWKYHMVAISSLSSRKNLRKEKCNPEWPFQISKFHLLCQPLHETQVHAIAAGHLVFMSFTRTGLQLSSLVLETLVLDVDNEGLWLYDIFTFLG